MRPAPLFALITMTLACALFAAPALAQRDRVFVASYGSDSNPCTFGSPCKTFQNAVNVVAVGGEVTAIDSAGFGPVNITQSVTITSPNGVEAGIVATSGGNAIAINNTSGATITLRGLTLEGSGVDDHGIFLTSNGDGTLNIIDTVVKDYVDSGIAINPEGGALWNITISNSYSLNNRINGIGMALTSGGNIDFVIDQTTASGNSSSGIDLNSAAGLISGFITRSQLNQNGNDGIALKGGGLGIKNSYIFQNLNMGVSLTNGSFLGISGSIIREDANGDLVNNASNAQSYGDNILGSVSGTVTTATFQ